MACPKCRENLERREKQFYWRQHWFPGMVCKSCNALYEDPAKPFIEGVRKLSVTRN